MKLLLNVCLSCVFTFIPLLVGPAGAQEQKPRIKTGGEITAGTWSWGSDLSYVRSHFVKAAEEFPEDKYDYRPNEDTRSFAEIVMHVARNNHRTAAWVLKKEEEDVTAFAFHSKVQAIAKLNESFDQLEEALKHKPGSKDVFESMLHASEHYGNLATYYRLNGLVPPASR